MNGIPYVTPYEIRHTFVSAIQCLPEAFVKSLVGHSRNMDTFGVYGHEFGSQERESAQMLERVFSGILSNQKTVE